MAGGWTVVLDVGKTLSKATLWDETGHCAVEARGPTRSFKSTVMARSMPPASSSG